MARTVNITRKTRTLGIAFSHHPSIAVPDEPEATGTAAQLAPVLASYPDSRAVLFVGGRRMTDDPRDVLPVLLDGKTHNATPAE